MLLLLLGVAGCASDPYGPNAAGICPLIRVAEMPMTIQHDVLFVDGTIDNQPVRLLVDSGAERTLLTEDAVKRLQLPRDTKHATRTIGIGGPSTSFDALLPHGLVLGGTDLPVDRVTVGPFSIAQAGGGAGADGLLGADILLAFDVDLNLPAHRLTMYRARRECPTAEPPWSAQYLAISGITTHRDRLMLPFVLDGVNGVAILDTGAQLSSISGAMAAKLGVSDNGPSEDAMITAHGAAPQEVQRAAAPLQRVAGRSSGGEWAADAGGADELRYGRCADRWGFPARAARMAIVLDPSRAGHATSGRVGGRDDPDATVGRLGSTRSTLGDWLSALVTAVVQ